MMSVLLKSCSSFNVEERKIGKLIYKDDGLVQAADFRVYQPKKDKTTIIQQHMYHLIPLELTDVH